MAHPLDFIFPDRRELFELVLKVCQAERNKAYEFLKKVRVEQTVIHDAKEKTFEGLIQAQPQLKIKWIFPNAQKIHFKDPLPIDRFHKPEKLLFFTPAYKKTRLFDPNESLTKDHPLFHTINSTVKSLTDTVSINRILSEENKRLIKNVIQYLTIFQRNLIEAKNKNDVAKINYILASKVILIGENGQAYQVTQQIALALISKDEYGFSTRKRSQTGMRSVFAQGGVHFKSLGGSLDPPTPGLEFSAYALAKALTNTPLLTPTMVIKLEGIHHVDPASLPGVLSKARVENINLEEALAEFSEKLEGGWNKVIEMKNFNYFVQASLTIGCRDLQEYLYFNELSMVPMQDVTVLKHNGHARELRLKLKGPDNSSYRHHNVYVQLEFGPNFPFEPPRIRFVANMFHPNISIEGDMSFDLLKSQWNPDSRLNDIVTFILNVLLHPNVNFVENIDAAALFDENPYAYKARATLEYELSQDSNELLNHFKSAPNHTFRMDPVNLSWNILLALLLEPGDGKSDNYGVEESEDGIIRIIGIDNDKIFYPHFDIRSKSIHTRVLTIFFCWRDIMSRSMDPLVRQQVLETPAEAILLNWLSTLSEQNEVYETLLRQGMITKTELNMLQLPIPMNSRVLTRVHSIWKSIQATLSYRSKTYSAILKDVHEDLGHFYESLRLKYSNPSEAMLVAYKGMNWKRQVIDIRDFLSQVRISSLENRPQNLAQSLTSKTIHQVLDSLMDIFDKDQFTPFIWHHLDKLHLAEHILHKLHQLDPQGVNRIDRYMKTPLDYAIEAYVHHGNSYPFVKLIELGATQTRKSIVDMYYKIPRDVEPVVDLSKSRMHRPSLSIHAAFDRFLRAFGGKALWEVTLNVLFPPYKGHGDFITGSISGRRCLLPMIVKQMDDSNRKTKYGRRHVVFVDSMGFKAYMKFYPIFPGIEEAIGILFREVIGWGTSYGELFKLPNGTPVWISLAIEGETFQEVINEKQEILGCLDLKHASDIILMTMLTNPEDGKPENYILEQVPERPHSYRIVCIDSDQSFVPTFVDSQPTYDPNNILVPSCQVKTILYCLNLMNKPIHDETKQHFLSLHIEGILKRWLEKLEVINHGYQLLFPHRDHTQNLLLQENWPCFIGIPFQKGCIATIFNKFYQLQYWLKQKEHCKITHFELLSKLDPFLAERYISRSRLNNIYLSFQRSGLGLESCSMVLESQVIAFNQSTLECIQLEEDLGPRQVLDELHRVIQQKASSNLEFIQYKSDFKLEEVLEKYDFSKHAFIDQTNLIRQLYTRHLKKMTIRSCTALNDTQVMKLRLNNLHRLDLINVDIKGECMKIISKSSLLEDFKITGCRSLEYIKEKPWVLFDTIRPLTFPYLRNLKIQSCLKLKDIAIRAPVLKTVEIKNCTLLSSLQILRAPLDADSLYELVRKKEGCAFDFSGCRGNLFEKFGNIIQQMNSDEYKQYMCALKNDSSNQEFHMINKKYADHLAKSLITNRTISRLALSFSKLSVEGAKYLSLNKTITHLDVSGNTFGDEGLKLLAQNTRLVELKLFGSNIGVAGAKVLGRYMKLKTLNLSSNFIGDNGAQLLALSNKTLTYLNVFKNRIGDVGAAAIATFPNLHKLDISYNMIGNEGAKALSESTSLIELNLMSNNITEEGGRALSQNRSILDLNLENNELQDSGVSYFQHNTTLITLNVSLNDIGPEGAKYLALNTSLRSLYLDSNNLGDEGVKYVSSSNTIVHLKMSMNNISDKGASWLARNSSIVYLNLNYNNIGDNGAHRLSENTSLKELEITYNSMSDEGARSLIKNTRLMTLNLEGNHTKTKDNRFKY